MIIDVHGHVTSPELLRRLPMPPSLGDIDGVIEHKAAHGIETTVVGSPVGAGTMVPLPGLDNYEQPLDQLEAFHDWLAETVSGSGGRLRAYAYVNPLGGDDELELLRKRLDQDEFVGVIANSTVRGRLLDGPDAGEFFDLVADRDVPVLLHAPAEPVGSAELAHVGLIEHIARPCDVTVGVAGILLAGWLQRYPDLRLIVSLGGGALALLPEKLRLARLRGSEGPPGPPTEEAQAEADRLVEDLRKLYVDTTTSNLAALRAAVDVFGVDHVLVGTDTPPLTSPVAGLLDRVGQIGLAEEERERVMAGNARELFRLEGSAK